MHRFLRSVGFRTYIKKRDIEKMLLKSLKRQLETENPNRYR